MTRWAPWALLALGLSQMAGDALGLPALRGVAAATAAAPAPKVFGSVAGHETFSARFALEWDGRSLDVTPEVYHRLGGPYDRRRGGCRGGPRPGADLIRYDGTCGVCHGFVRFVLAEDREPGGAFRFCPLDDGASASTVVVETAGGGRLERSDGALHVLARLGGIWGVAAAAIRLLPRRLCDSGYDAVARVRRHLAEAPPEACPVLPPELRSRFRPPS